jgi:hypothetical protein
MKQELWSRTSVQTNKRHCLLFQVQDKMLPVVTTTSKQHPAGPQRKQHYAVCRLFDMRRIFQGYRDNRTNKAVNFMNDSIK